MLTSFFEASQNLAVVPILIGPLQVLLAILPAILVAVGGAILAMLKPSSIKLGLQVLWRNKVSTVVTVAVIVGAVYGFSYLPGCGGGKASAFQGKAEWTMYRGGLERRGGGMDGAPDPVGSDIVWSFTYKFKKYYSSPSIVGNRIVASASANPNMFKPCSEPGGIFCIDAQNGAKVWEFTPSDFRCPYSSPSVAGKYVVCGEGLHETRPNPRIVCLSFEDGKKLWEVKANSHVESSPCIYSNMVYCGAGADGIYAMRLDTPAGKSPVVWHLQNFRDAGLAGTNTFHVDGSLAAWDGRVYFGSAGLHDGDWSGVACVDAATGKLKWKVDTTMCVWGSPTIVSNRLFIGMGNGNMAQTAEQFWAMRMQELKQRGVSQQEIDAQALKFAPGGEFWCMDAVTGKTNWVRKLGKSMLGCAAAAEGQLYFAASDGLLTCVSLDNELLGQWNSHEAINTCPAVGSNTVYVITDSGRFFALDRRTLKPLWQKRFTGGAQDLFTSSPIVAGGHIYIGTPQDGLVCMGTPPDQQTETVWGGARGGAGKSACLDGSALPPKGSFAWRWPAESESSNAVPPVSGGMACLNNTLFVPVNCGALTGVAAMAVAGTSSKAPESNLWFAATAHPVVGSVAATTSRVYFAEGRTGDTGRKLRCVDAVRGQDLWQVPVDAASSGEFLLTASNVLAYCQNGMLTCLATKGSKAGQPLWSAPLGKQVTSVGAPSLTSAGVVLAATSGGVLALDVTTGRELWHSQDASAAVTGPAANDDITVVATAGGLSALSLVNGATLWTTNIAPSTAPLVVDDERVLCTTAGGEVVALGWDGKERFRLRNAAPGMPAMLLNDKLVFLTPGELRKVELSEKNAESRWLDTSWLGTVTTPPILSDGKVYFATLEKGLICARQGKR
jgi:outer membrane protein assembly factor BamB